MDRITSGVAMMDLRRGKRQDECIICEEMISRKKGRRKCLKKDHLVGGKKKMDELHQMHSRRIACSVYRDQAVSHYAPKRRSNISYKNICRTIVFPLLSVVRDVQGDSFEGAKLVPLHLS